jgi:hypothetical protein
MGFIGSLVRHRFRFVDQEAHNDVRMKVSEAAARGWSSRADREGHPGTAVK